MKEGIHPKYEEAKVTCACGNTFMAGSVQKELRVTYVPSATRSIPGNNVTWQHVAELKNSTNATISKATNMMEQSRALCSVCIRP